MQGLDKLAERIQAGDRQALAKGITLIESTKPADRVAAGRLLDELLSHTGGSMRIGVSGSPGVGKSTLLNAMGQQLVGHGSRVAVLTVDPSSERTGGSILGDKTRMGDLVRSDQVFVRPSPAATTLGGVARGTRDSILLCEAAGFDVVLVETVGIGQSETAVSQMTDVFVLLVAPGGGDELQGIKRGVMELADLVVVTKADGDLQTAATRTAADYRSALQLMRPKWPGLPPKVTLSSANDVAAVAGVLKEIEIVHSQLCDLDILGELRTNQALQSFEKRVTEAIVDAIEHNQHLRTIRDENAARVAAMSQSVSSAVLEVAAAISRPGV